MVIRYIIKKIWYKKYKLEDLLSNDYPEIIDETLNIKSQIVMQKGVNVRNLNFYVESDKSGFK